MRCTRGSIFLVMVDLPSRSRQTRNGWVGVELSAGNRRMAYVPEGFAQGYQTLEDDTEVLYQMSHEYVARVGTRRALGRSCLRHRVAARGRTGSSRERDEALAGRRGMTGLPAGRFW